MTSFQPMLAGKATDSLKELRFPLYASPKLDGVRAVVINGVLLSRRMKPIPNAHVQRMFGKHKYNGLDGELICGSPTHPAAFRNTTSAVMSSDGMPDVQFHVFDSFAYPTAEFRWRLEDATKKVKGDNVVLVEQRIIDYLEDLHGYESECLSAGYEGVMLRWPGGPYKYGRSTVREAYLLKLKRFSDSEAEVIGFEEQLHNGNEATKDAFGRTERSSHKDNKTGKGTLGALVVKDINNGVEFSVGTGYDAATRQMIWDSQDDYIGKIVKYKFFSTGSKDKPRFPVFQGFRDVRDM